MTPNKYETLIDQLLDEQVDMDELRKLFDAEKNKRDSEKKRESYIKIVRKNFVDELICYLEEIFDNDKDLIEWLETEEAFEEIEKTLIETEKAVKKARDLISDPGFESFLKKAKEKGKVDEDALKKWLNIKNNKFPF